MIIPLDEIEVGQQGTIVEMPKNSSHSMKLLSLGILPGDSIEVTGRALFGGPISLRHSNNTFFALRRSHASQILISIQD